MASVFKNPFLDSQFNSSLIAIIFGDEKNLKNFSVYGRDKCEEDEEAWQVGFGWVNPETSFKGKIIPAHIKLVIFSDELESYSLEKISKKLKPLNCILYEFEDNKCFAIGSSKGVSKWELEAINPHTGIKPVLCHAKEESDGSENMSITFPGKFTKPEAISFLMQVLGQKPKKTSVASVARSPSVASVASVAFVPSVASVAFVPSVASGPSLIKKNASIMEPIIEETQTDSTVQAEKKADTVDTVETVETVDSVDTVKIVSMNTKETEVMLEFFARIPIRQLIEFPNAPLFDYVRYMQIEPEKMCEIMAIILKLGSRESFLTIVQAMINQNKN